MKAVFSFMSGTGSFSTDQTHEWSYSFGISSLTELQTKLREKKLEALVGKLAIVAHGDEGGQIKLDRVLTPVTFPTFKEEFVQLSWFMAPNSKLLFMSCIAGAGVQGTTLLANISYCLPHTTVIGFETFGVIAGKFISAPGQVYETTSGITNPPLGAFRNLKQLSEESPFAKWVQLGAVIRKPYAERSADPKHRCAAINCPGHKNAVDRCVPK